MTTSKQCCPHTRKPSTLNARIHMNELTNANACPCGGVAQFHAIRDYGDTPHLFCSNPRCGRIVPAVNRTIAETVEIWNKEIENEIDVVSPCPPHSWFRQEDGTFKCPCGASIDHVSEQAAAVDTVLKAIFERRLGGRPRKTDSSNKGPIRNRGRWEMKK